MEADGRSIFVGNVSNCVFVSSRLFLSSFVFVAPFHGSISHNLT